jgi:hypothetical protein
MEIAVKQTDAKSGKDKESASMPDDWNSPSVRQWIEMDPSLAKVDLGDYFWVTRDRLQSTMSGISMVPPLVRRLFEGLVGANPSTRAAAVTGAASLSDAERAILYELLDRNVQRSPADKSGYDAFRALVEARVADSAKHFATTLTNAPHTEIPPAVGTDVDTLAKSNSQLRPIFEPVLSKLEKSSGRVGAAVKAARKPKQK